MSGKNAGVNDVVDAIRTAYDQLMRHGAGRPGSIVYLSQIRDALGERYPRPLVDQALITVGSGDYPGCSVEPGHPADMTGADQDAAVFFGGQWNHMISYYDEI